MCHPGPAMREERRLLSDEAWARIVEAKRDGGICAACGRVLSDDEPVWRLRVASRLGWSSHFSQTYRWVFVGRECATPETVEASDGGTPVPCGRCGRGLHVAVGPGRGTTTCSIRCQTAVQRRRSRGGQPS